MSKFLEGLNPSQKKAVMAIEGPVQINAVAGSGKTRVLTHRIAYMLEQGVKPQSILCTTFTKKATEEMTERLGKLIPKSQLMLITMGTTHSIAYKILSKEYKNQGNRLAAAFDYKNKDGILVNGSQKRFAEQVKKSIMYDRTVEFTVKQAMTDIPIPALLKVCGLAKNEYISAKAFQSKNSGRGAGTEAHIEFYLRYEQMKQAECKLDMDDLLYNLVGLFEKHPDMLKKYQAIYKYLLVDEAQDNNALQYRLIKQLGHPEYNIFIVGDDDQSMYGFRGSKPEQFIHFQENYRGVTTIPLEDNYRSNPGILDVANQLIRNNTERLIKSLKAHKQDVGDCVAYSYYETDNEEGEGVAKEIKVLVDKEGLQPKNIAVLYRTNAQSRAIEDALIVAGLPYVIHGSISFYERKEVRDILAYLELAVDNSNNKAFERVVNVPSRYLGKAFMEKVKYTKGSYFQSCMSAAQKDYERRGIQNFIDKINDLADMVSQGMTPTEIVEYIMGDEGVGYKKSILDEGEDEDEGNSRLENIATLQHVLTRFTDLKTFLEYIRMMTTKAKHDINGVQVMTVHKSKGLEFHTVFVVGASEGLLPHFKAVQASQGGKPLAIEEERRLMYVAVTRAEAQCYISSISEFNGKKTSKSRFVGEMGLKESPVPEAAATSTEE